MSSEVAVSVEGVVKSFKLLTTPTAQLFNLIGLQSERFLARKHVLKGISFDVKKGENVGILGINGAGKSTLLNMIAGMSKPTAGRIVVRGSIGAILELGAGFHQELTGRQNAETHLLLQGVRPAEIDAHLDQIKVFSELGEDFETKVRTYSSGMMVRLAFAVSCALTPDVFIIDEALAVGDARFQQKCYNFLLNRMANATLILISHDMSAISAICDRVVIISAGEIAFDGTPAEGIPVYNKIAQGKGRVSEMTADDEFQSLKSGPCQIDIGAAFMTVDGLDSRMTKGGCLVSFALDIENHLANPADIVAGLTIVDTKGQKVFGQSTSNTRLLVAPVGKSRVRMEFEWPKIAPGKYSVTLGVGQGKFESMQTIQCWINNCFEIENVLDEVAHGLFNITLKTVEME
jgi:ABC-type polysaccharide/polyol phosphate transport system ATPase subunit